MNAKPSQITFPRYCYYDDVSEENVNGPLTTVREGLRRKSGLYSNLTFFVTASPDGNSVSVTAPIMSSHFVFIARAVIEVQYDSEQKSAVVLHEDEDEMGEGNISLRLTTNTEAQKSKAAVNYILAASDQVFGKLVNILFPEKKSLPMRFISWILMVNAKVLATTRIFLLLFRLRVLLCLCKSSA